MKLLYTALLGATAANAAVSLSFQGTVSSVSVQNCDNAGTDTNCEKYCHDYASLCSGTMLANEYTECLKVCGPANDADVGTGAGIAVFQITPEQSANPWICRGYHLNVAKTLAATPRNLLSGTTYNDAEAHCYHAGLGYGPGEDMASPACPALCDADFKKTQCELFCSDYSKYCDSTAEGHSPPDSPLQPDDVNLMGNCVAQCVSREVAFPGSDTGAALPGSAWGCRAYHLGVAAAQTTRDGRSAHCNHAGKGIQFGELTPLCPAVAALTFDKEGKNGPTASAYTKVLANATPVDFSEFTAADVGTPVEELTFTIKAPTGDGADIAKLSISNGSGPVTLPTTAKIEGLATFQAYTFTFSSATTNAVVVPVEVVDNLGNKVETTLTLSRSA